jgi:ABC-2 type transport system permease protein
MRIATLVKMQMTNRKFLSKLGDKKKVILYLILRLVLIVGLTFGFYYILTFFNNIMYLKVDKNMLLFFLGITQIFSIIGMVNILDNELYLSKDNIMLFSFPTTYDEIFASKIIKCYINEFIKNLYFIIPLTLSFGIFLNADFLYYLNMIIVSILLPLFPILIGAILSIPIVVVKLFIKKIPVLQSIIYLIFMSFIMVIVVKLVKQIPNPLRIVALYNQFISSISNFMIEFNKYLLFYNNLINILFRTRQFTDYLIIFGLIIAFSIILYLVSRPFYFKLTNFVSNSDDVVLFHRSTKNKVRSTFSSFFIKELKDLYRTPNKLFDYVFMVISFPFLMYVINSIFSAINTSIAGDSLVIGFNIIIGLVISTAGNTISATALSTEGEEFATLKTAPTNTYKISWAKILVNIIFSNLGILMGMVVLLFFAKIQTINILLLFIALIFLNTGHIFKSFQIDLLNPQFLSYATTGNVNNNTNVAKSMIVGIILAVVFGIIAIFALLDNLYYGWFVILSLSLVYFVLRFYLLTINIKVYYKRIEM